ncbi:MAG: outer membrane protein assembly factor BamA [Lentisphaeria bacterium]|nr:outer membrane protein assembly factor BamA [Lentisphaeria bacterium]MBR7119686.1 outer membrane protein assembly factor BamA [Lentisphaeria bacterium]
MNLKKQLLALAAGAFFACGAAEVGSVVFEQSGATRLQEAMLKAYTRLAPGVEFSRDKLDADIKSLHNTGHFSDVTGETETAEDGKIKVTYRLKSRPRISKIEFSGNVKFPTHELGKELTLHPGMVFSDKELLQSTRNLRKFYHDRGYLEANIQLPHIVTAPDGTVSITFVIVENLRLKVNDVTFEGASKFSEWDLRHSIANRFNYINWVPLLRDYIHLGMLDRTELELDKARLRDKYHDEGYLDFKVEEVTSKPTADDPEFVDLNFKIKEGEPYKVGKVVIHGNTIFKNGELERCIRLVENGLFRRSDEESTVRGIISLYETLGHCDVSCRAVRKEDFEKKVCHVDLVITEGRKYNVRDVIIVGNTATKEKVIRRELAIQPGDPVDRNRIDVSRRRLLGMGYFTKVEAAAVNAESLAEKDVRITVEEKESRYQFRIGAGVSDTNSFFGMAEISTDNFDVANPKNWFYGGGQRLRLRGILGVENAGFNLDFIEPWFADMPIRFELSGFMNTVEYDNWDEERIGGRMSFQRKIFDDFTSVALGYKFELVRVTDPSHRLEDYLDHNDQTGTHRVSQPSLMLVRDTRDSLTDPTEGYRISLFGSITPRALGSSADYYRLEAKASYYTSFFDKAIIVMAGAKVGTVAAFNRNDDVPVFERYFLGGGDSLRGFEYRTVGPVRHDENIGGQSVLLLTAEVSHPIWGPVRGAFFIDAGNAPRSSWSMRFSDINIGAGWGLRIKLPQINVPIKLDIAYPFLNNQDNERSKVRLHFNVGFTF